MNAESGITKYVVLHGCVQLIFAPIQLVEKTHQHENLFVMFVDMWMVYGFTLQEALWNFIKGLYTLNNVGNHEDFHDSMLTEVKV